MGVWPQWDIAKRQATVELARAEQRKWRSDQARLAAPEGIGPRRQARRGLRRGASAWLGYRMIGVGCRLARPAIVAGARSVQVGR